MVMENNLVSTIFFQVRTFSSVEAFLEGVGLSGSWDGIEVAIGQSWVVGSVFVASLGSPATLALKIIGCNVGLGSVGGLFEFHHPSFAGLCDEHKRLLATNPTFGDLFRPAIAGLCDWMHEKNIHVESRMLEQVLGRRVSYICSHELGQKRFLSLSARKTPGRLTYIGPGNVDADQSFEEFVAQWTSRIDPSNVELIPNKYTGLSDEERSNSRFLQLLWLCLFDLLMKAVFDATPDSESVRQLAILRAEHLSGEVNQMDLVAAAEPAAALMAEVHTGDAALEKVWDGYSLVYPKARGQQTQLIALMEGVFTNVAVVADDGKLLAVRADIVARPGSFIFAVFHGVSEGSDTVEAVETLKRVLAVNPGAQLVACFDANTTVAPGNAQKLSISAFQDAARGLQCHPSPGSEPDYTVFGGRTPLQAQPHKAVCNPVKDQRDFLLCSLDVDVEEFKIERGADGVMPSPSHPADHAALYAVVRC